MSFAEDFVRIWTEGGHDAAFIFVEELFTDPNNQKRKGKPTDWLHDDDDDDDDERDVPAAKGFAAFVHGFRPKRTPASTAKWILDRIEESRAENPHLEDTHAFQPWNQLEFQLGHYERLDVQALSVHASETKRVRQYGLYHEILGDRDTKEDYHFTYELGHGDEHCLRYGDEVVPGPVAHAAAKAAIYAPYLRQVVDALVADVRFAAIPKAFPFRFRFHNDEYGKLAFDVELAPPLDAAALAGHPLRETHLAAAKVPEVTRDQRFLYYLVNARGDAGTLPDLVAMVRGAPDLIEALRVAGEDAILAARAVDAHGRDRDALAAAVKGDARLEEYFEIRPPADPDTLVAKVRGRGAPLLLVLEVLRAVGASDAARALARARFELPAPTWSAHEDDELRVAAGHIDALREILTKAPPEERVLLAPLYDAALDRMASSGHPLVALSILEARVPEEKREAFEDEDEHAEDEDEDEDAGDGQDDVEALLDDDADDDPPKARAAAPVDLGPPPPDQDAFDELPAAAKVLVREGSRAYLDAVIASTSVRRYGRFADETVTRLKAYGSAARAAEPALRAFLTDLCKDGYNHDSEVATVAEVLWRIGAEDVPEEVHAAHRSNEFYMESFYPKWSKAAPARRLQRLLGALRAEPAAAASPKVWEDGLYDSAPAFAMYREAIAAAPERDAWITGLVRAIAGGANDLVFRFVRDWGREVSRKDQALTRTLLEPLEARLSDEDVAVKYGYNEDRRADTARLRRARLHGLTGLLEADALEADAELARLHARYPGDATIAFLETMRAARRDGPRAAGVRTIEHARRMSEGDIVYAKAFFQYTRTTDERWESVDTGHAFGLHDLAERRFRKDAWTDGKLDANPSELDEDPLFEGMYRDVSELEDDGKLDAALAGYRRAVAVLDGSPGDLVGALDPGNWELSWQVVKKLARDPSPAHLATMVQVYGWFADDEGRRRLLAELMWPLPGARDALLADATFRKHLGEFIWRYPGSSEDLARSIFAQFAARGEDEHIVATAETMRPRLVIAVAISILNAYIRLRRFDDAVALLEKCRQDVKPKQPEWVLVAANIAGLQAQAGRLDAAEATLAELFSRDWSNFEYKKKKDDGFAAVLGGDLDAQYTMAFRRYWAMAKFNAGCLHALRGRAAEAVASLREAVRYAPDAYPAAKLRAERDLASLADDPDYRQLLAELPSGGAA
jgi:hypothetical protein